MLLSKPRRRHHPRHGTSSGSTCFVVGACVLTLCWIASLIVTGRCWDGAWRTAEALAWSQGQTRLLAARLSSDAKQQLQQIQFGPSGLPADDGTAAAERRLPDFPVPVVLYTHAYSRVRLGYLTRVLDGVCAAFGGASGASEAAAPTTAAAAAAAARHSAAVLIVVHDGFVAEAVDRVDHFAERCRDVLTVVQVFHYEGTSGGSDGGRKGQAAHDNGKLKKLWWWMMGFVGESIWDHYDGTVLFIEDDHLLIPKAQVLVRAMETRRRVKASTCGADCWGFSVYAPWQPADGPDKKAVDGRKDEENGMPFDDQGTGRGEVHGKGRAADGAHHRAAGAAAGGAAGAAAVAAATKTRVDTVLGSIPLQQLDGFENHGYGLTKAAWGRLHTDCKDAFFAHRDGWDMTLLALQHPDGDEARQRGGGVTCRGSPFPSLYWAPARKSALRNIGVLGANMDVDRYHARHLGANELLDSRTLSSLRGGVGRGAGEGGVIDDGRWWMKTAI